MTSALPIYTIFNEARDLPVVERAAYLRSACGDDDELRARVEALLQADAAAEEFLPGLVIDGQGDDLPGDGHPGERSGDMIGRYKLLEQIGEGGFGTVWMAEQKEPVRRRVALKILKLGMDTRQAIARFEAERQALAMMDHPNIAKVLDGGATENGRLYFVMELVQGVPITEYCDEARLGVRDRVRLFTDVCSAIQHAHQKGVIHRDIKPSNVLVTLYDGVPAPKVIDFGVAKATSAELTQKTLFTGFRQMVGTPDYMAPEQAAMSGLDIDTRADVYSLGVLLYELLTGGAAGRSDAGARDRLRRGAAHDSRAGTEAAVDPHPDARGHRNRCAQPSSRAARARARARRRPGLDHHHGDREGPPPPLRHGLRSRAGSPALPWRGADLGAPADRRLPRPEVRAQEPGRCRIRGVAAGNPAGGVGGYRVVRVQAGSLAPHGARAGPRERGPGRGAIGSHPGLAARAGGDGGRSSPRIPFRAASGIGVVLRAQGVLTAGAGAMRRCVGHWPTGRDRR